MGIVYNKLSGLLKDGNDVYYCKDLVEDGTSIKLEMPSSWVSEAVFFNEKYAGVLFHNSRELVVVDLEDNLLISKIEVHGEGSATSMSYDSVKKRLVVSVRDGSVWDDKSSFGFVYLIKVSQGQGGVPLLEKVG